ncbi:DUF5410 family protein [Rickettsia endosymbiont of Polydrusus tereticollis]|uniref:DUF5410 family protein n=1 Tax=Rickettsia endosymbiont of Polydrusus tereticollis TaxID=3066251 RepID=UPI0031331E92
MQNSILIKNEEMVILTRNIISNIVAGEVTKEDLIELKDTLGKTSQGKERKAFVKALNEVLDNNSLHKLNHAVMENAVVFSDCDPSFLCRIPATKIFQELFVLEAKRQGMKAKFDVNGNLEPLKPEDIPPAILDHYATLKEHLYNKIEVKSSLDLDTRIAQSINFMVYGPIVRESTDYTKLSNLAQAILEVEIQKIDGSYIQELSKSGISQYIEKVLRETALQINPINKDKTEIKFITDKIIKEIGNELKITPESIIVDSIEKLEEKFLLDNKQKEKIFIKLSSCLGNVDNIQLIEKKEKLISIISQELANNRTNFSKKINIFLPKYYKTTTKKLEDIETEIINHIEKAKISEEVFEGLPDWLIEGLKQCFIGRKTVEKHIEQYKKEKVSKVLPDSVTGSVEQNLDDSGIAMLGENHPTYFGGEGA